MLASTDDGLDDLYYVGASDGPKISLGPFRQNVDGKVAPVFFGRARSFVALSVLLQISIRQRPEGTGRGGFTLDISGLDGIGAVRLNQTSNLGVGGSNPSERASYV